MVGRGVAMRLGRIPPGLLDTPEKRGQMFWYGLPLSVLFVGLHYTMHQESAARLNGPRYDPSVFPVTSPRRASFRPGSGARVSGARASRGSDPRGRATNLPTPPPGSPEEEGRTPPGCRRGGKHGRRRRLVRESDRNATLARRQDAP